MTDVANASQARTSTLLVAAMLTLLGAWQLNKGHTFIAGSLGVLGLGLFVVSFVTSGAVLFYVWWMRLARLLGAVNSRIVLTIVYWLLITPIGLVVRLVGHDPLARRVPRQNSYWSARTKKRQTPEEFERAF